LAGQRVQATTTNTNLAQAWNAISLENSWTNFASGYVTAQYRLVNQVTCEVIGWIKPGTLTSGTVLFALPSGYYNPNNLQLLIAQNFGTDASLLLEVGTTGNVTTETAATSGQNYFIHGFVSLDA
jgi:hypothetical protein